MLRQYLSWQFVGFMGVGMTAAAANWLSRVGFSVFVPFSLAVPLAYGVGMATAFTLNRFFVFPRSDLPISTQVRRFLVINFSFVPVVWIGALLLVELLTWLGQTQYVEETAHAFALALPMLATFLLYKLFAFKSGGSDATQS